ncbi:MAG: DNA polymerase III subunit alpha, partial [Desulfovibrionaceae bacterium]|nr:DNA polymerase III subunit alpha [Desulfovibrionaceae bacterium]
LNKKLLDLSRLSGLPLVATNDCHYLNREDAEAHDLLLCIQNKAKVDEVRRMRMDTDELYYKSPAEMEKTFAWAPEALDNAGRIADLCENYAEDLTPKGVYYFPRFETPAGVSLDEEFRRLARAGLEGRLEKLAEGTDPGEYQARLEMELEVIGRMGYQSYFLIVRDFIDWAKRNGVPVGPGRGSAAGSLAAWALGITNLDPIAYNLLFERFLNPDRKKLPDIDVDFCERKRSLVLQYISERYGADAVAQITTFGTLKTKAVIKDVGRALGLDFEETNRLAALVGEAEREIRRLNKSLPAGEEEIKLNMALAMKYSPRLKELYEQSAEGSSLRKLLDISKRLEGLSRHASTHASAVVISDRPMVEYLPLYHGKHDELVTQYDMKNVEQIGLVKFDFLGLRTMTVLHDALDLIRSRHGRAPDLEDLPLDDQATYRLYSSGDTDGIFQVESDGMRRYLRKLKPTRLEDIIAMIALYRPGPLEGGMVDYFIECKHGAAEVVYPLPILEDCLKSTYGVIVYQEQAMQIARLVAGFTQGEADDLRKAIGGKNKEIMLAQRNKFMEGARNGGVPEGKAAEIFGLIEKFAGYGFNKSHSAAYALISYQTAYLKAHYAPEFMAALLSSEIGNQDRLLKYMDACRDLSLRVEKPSVQEGGYAFSVRNGSILFGLGGVRNVGSEAIREIVEEREKNGVFASLLDLCSRVNLRKVTKRSLEYLIKGGAMDVFGCPRRVMCEALGQALALAQKKQKEAGSGQLSMLALAPPVRFSGNGGLGMDLPEQALEEWPDEEKLHYEKEALGFFLSGHPLGPFRRIMGRLGLLPLEEARELAPGEVIRTAVLMSDFAGKRIKKSGKYMANCRVSDFTSSGECLFFADLAEEARLLFEEGAVSGADPALRGGEAALSRPSPSAFLLTPETPLLRSAPSVSKAQSKATAPAFRPGVPFELTAVVLADRLEEASGFEEEEEALPKEIKLKALSMRPLMEAVRNDSAPWQVECGLDDLEEKDMDGLKDILLRHATDRDGVELRLLLCGRDRQCLMRLPAYRLKPGLDLDADPEGWERGLRL